MILTLRIEPMVDKTKVMKRLMTASLITDIKGAEKIFAISHLPSECVLGKEIDTLITGMITMQQNKKMRDAIKAPYKKVATKRKVAKKKK